jgi:hypothetical protein
MKINHLLLLSLAALPVSVAARSEHAATQEYYLCETKTGGAERWFFSSIFLGDPYYLKTAAPEDAFTKYVIRNYRDTVTTGIGPADCHFFRTREEAEDLHTSMSKWAVNARNSIVETGWTYSE